MTDAFAPARHPRIPVFRTAYDAYRLGIGAIFGSSAMFRFFVYGSVLSIAVLGAEFYLLYWSGMNLSESTANILALIMPLMTYVALTAVQTPLGIAIQRRLLLGDVPTRSYAAYATDRRGINYGIVLLAICAFYALASLIEIPVALVVFGEPFAPADTQGDDMKFTAFSSFMALAWTVVFACASWMSAKCAFIFPAVACDRPESWRQFYDETRGNVWVLFAVFVFALLPVALLCFVVFVAAFVSSLSPLMAAMNLGEGASEAAMEQALSSILVSPAFIVAYAIAGVGYMLSFIVTAAGAARAYQIRVEGGMSGVAEVFS
jgi:hypothetical protein